MPPRTSFRLPVAALRPRRTLSARLQIIVRQSNLRAYPNHQAGFSFLSSTSATIEPSHNRYRSADPLIQSP